MPRRTRTPLAIDLFCGLGGWTGGLIAAGFNVVGFDLERHEYGEHRYPAQLVLQDVRTIHGSQLRNASLIVASPPCQSYSYMAMPWTRAKQMIRDYDSGVRDTSALNELFDACFRIQREAIEADGRHIPLVVENVRGAQRWVGRSRWNFGSYHFWGDVPALMPIPVRAARCTSRDCGAEGIKQGGEWFHESNGTLRQHGSKSTRRKAASALIAKIPFTVADHIGRTYYRKASCPD